MNLRDWLIVVGVIIILGILIDGYRRMRLARRDSLQMSRDMGGNIEASPLDDDFNPELPGGGARVVARNEDEQLEDAVQEPELGLDTDTVEQEISESSMLSASAEDRIDRSAIPTAHAGQTKARARAETASSSENKESAASSNGPQEVLVINVDARTNVPFEGLAIKQLLEACGLDHGEMSIFHRHEEDDLLSPIQFSVANAVEPGYFDPEKMDQLTTPGVSFFMSLPGPKDYMKAFDFMLETAQCFAKNLGGELRDEQRSVMTTQTIEHCRQRIREFERKQLSMSRV